MHPILLHLGGRKSMGFFHPFPKNKNTEALSWSTAQQQSIICLTRPWGQHPTPKQKGKWRNNGNKNCIHFPRVISKNSAVSSVTEEQCDLGQATVSLLTVPTCHTDGQSSEAIGLCPYASKPSEEHLVHSIPFSFSLLPAVNSITVATHVPTDPLIPL